MSRPFRTLSRISRQSRERSGAEPNPFVRNLVSPYGMGEYSCRCHGKRVISAPSDRTAEAETCMLCTFYRVKLDCVPKDFVRRRFVLAIFAIRSEMAYSRFSVINFISPQRSNAKQNPLVRTFIIPQTIPLPSYSFNRLNCTSKSSI